MVLQPVPDYGPYDAPLLVLAEAGGKEEGRLGKPMQGVTGKKVRRLIENAGMDPENEVKYANVIPWAMPSLPKTFGAMKLVIERHWEDLNPTLSIGQHKAVLMLGRAALYRLTGLTGIIAEQGSTYVKDLFGTQVPCVASVHPASVMRSKLEAGWSLVDVAVTRACDYARGLPFDHTAQSPSHINIWSGCDFENYIQWDSKTITLDTEFDTRTNKPFLVGIAFDTGPILSVRPNDETIPILRQLLDGPATKIFHHAPADIASLAAIGVDVRPPIDDTLRFNSILFPDLPVGLSKVTLFRLAHWRNWKNMGHDDPAYNAIDVEATRQVREHQYVEMGAGNMWPVWEREARHMGLLCMAMEARGLQVDLDAARTTIIAYQKDIDAATVRLKEIADGLFASRVDPLRDRLGAIDRELDKLDTVPPVSTCPDHPKYTGQRKPSKKASSCVTCATIYESLAGTRDKKLTLRKERTGLKGKVDRWTLLNAKTGITGFDPGNNDHARWVLYDKAGFGFPVQRHEGRISANATAMARLRTLKKVQDNPLGVEFINLRQQRQHLAKMISTFLRPALDENECAHPVYRDYGTGTGRLAGGADDDLGDKKTNPYAYSAMNIPNKTRHIYVPHADVLNVTLQPIDKDLDAASTDIDDDSPSDEGEV